MTFTLLLLSACVTPDPPPAVPVPAGPSAGAGAAKARPAKAKGGGGAAKAGKGAAGTEPAVGAPGAGTVAVDVVQSNGAVDATLALAFADGSTKSVPLGQLPGTCTEIGPETVEHGGRTATSLFTFDCTAGGQKGKGYVLQVEQQLVVVSATQPAGAKKPRIKLLKNVPLVAGVVLSRKG